MNLEDLRAGVLELLTLRPCHVTGMHVPDHHLTHTCAEQKTAALDELLTALGIDLADAKHALHGNCYSCHGIPTQEEYRERRRQTHRWAGVPVPPEMAEPADDAPRPGDTSLVLVCVTDQWQPWADVLETVEEATGFHRDRIATAIRQLITNGAIEDRSHPCVGLRLTQAVITDDLRKPCPYTPDHDITTCPRCDQRIRLIMQGQCQCSTFPMAGGAKDCPNHKPGAVPV